MNGGKIKNLFEFSILSQPTWVKIMKSDIHESKKLITITLYNYRVLKKITI
jgi:hypothetical protein